MIVPMAKVLLTGPKERLIEALTVVQQLGVMHIDAARDGQQCFPVDQYLNKLAVPVEQKLVAEGLFLERLGREIKELGQLIGGREGRRSYLTPEAALTSLPGLVKTHIRRCTAWSTAYARQQERRRALARYGRLLAAAAALVPDPAGFAALEAIGVVIADAEAFTALVNHLKTAGDCFIEVKFLPTEHGEQIGLVIAERGAAPSLREALEAHGVAELQCPEDALVGLPFAEKRTAVAKMMSRESMLQHLRLQGEEAIRRLRQEAEAKVREQRAAAEVHPDDQGLARAALPQALIVGDRRITGGLAVKGQGGRMRVDNTLAKRLERAWPELLPKLLSELGQVGRQ